MLKKNILIAGGTGLVGANLSLLLHDQGINFLSTYHTKQPSFLAEKYKAFDFTDYDQCLCATKDMDTVIICAGQSYGIKITKEQPSKAILPNLKIVAGLFEAARVNRVEKTLFISSSTVYHSDTTPIREEELDLNKATPQTYRGIGWVNRYLEQLAFFYKAHYGMDIRILRPTSIFGPYDKFDDRSNVIPALIKRAVAKEKPFLVWGTGHDIRDFIFAEDFSRIVLQVLSLKNVEEPINVGSGRPTSILELVELILNLCEHEIKPSCDASMPSAIPYRMLHLGRMNSLLGDVHVTSLSQALSKTIAWYKTGLKSVNPT